MWRAPREPAKMTTEPCSLSAPALPCPAQPCPRPLNPGCFRGVADFDFDCPRNGADRQANAVDGVLCTRVQCTVRQCCPTVRSQGRGAALAWLVMCSLLLDRQDRMASRTSAFRPHVNLRSAGDRSHSEPTVPTRQLVEPVGCTTAEMITAGSCQ